MIVSGRVIHGHKRGKALGFPTINISTIDLENINSGVYAGKTCIEDTWYKCAIYIHPVPKRLLEAHIIKFTGNLYGQEIQIHIGEKIREACKFESVTELRNQIHEDVKAIEKTIDSNS